MTTDLTPDNAGMYASTISPNDFSNYYIGTNLTNAFALGEIGAEDDFFLVGAPATEVDAYPVITGNFLDADRKPLFRIVRNVLVVNPRHCSKILGTHIGFEIHDGQDNPILRVESRYVDRGKGEYVTTISGTFYTKSGAEIRADGRALTWSKDYMPKMAVGFSNGHFTVVSLMTNTEMSLAAQCIISGGAIHRILTGEIENQKVDLDGKLLLDATVKNCEVSLTTGDFAMAGNLKFLECTVKLAGPAAVTIGFYRSFLNVPSALKPGTECKCAGLYLSFGCEHQSHQMFAVGDKFPACLQCGKEIEWDLQRF